MIKSTSHCDRNLFLNTTKIYSQCDKICLLTPQKSISQCHKNLFLDATEIYFSNLNVTDRKSISQVSMQKSISQVSIQQKSISLCRKNSFLNATKSISQYVKKSISQCDKNVFFNATEIYFPIRQCDLRFAHMAGASIENTIAFVVWLQSVHVEWDRNKQWNKPDRATMRPGCVSACIDHVTYVWRDRWTNRRVIRLTKHVGWSFVSV